nr:VWA domain-containing protein [Gemmatimonadota bacterium]NIR77332.1 VWA domain-containing protein [Gemmatimonadota bacterium]NIT85858.1 VWA domain-containing protein [Gemmatimonadota bacterium]NIU29680.1 VWA domain-containing protein [Gemmatimonadota bacterium]NIU34724.1 VWA domain-containing protein [Gemmatimonadota bacterium]
MFGPAKIGFRLLTASLLALALAPAGAGAQGWIEPPPNIPGRWGVERVRTEVRVEVEGRTASVTVSEWFRNGGRRVAEGDYFYPLPGEAAFGSFSLYQGETELRGEIMDAEKARSIYEAIVRRRKDPALIELAGHGLLRARVFPIEPGETRKVTLRYTQLLERAGDALHFRYAAPRVGEGTGGGQLVRNGHGPDRDLRRPEAAPLSFVLIARDGDRFLDPFSPTHDLETERPDGRLRVRTGGALDGRLSIFLPLAGEGVGLTMAAHALPGEDGYFMLTLSPGRAEPVAQPRDLTVVLDVSGSMSGEKIAQARAALVDLLGTLEARDRFRLIAFSSAVRPYALEWRSASESERERARHWVDALVADGGTNIGAALDEAFRLRSPGERLGVVVFLTDGIPSVGERSVDRIAARAESRRGDARVFAFGVG